MVRLFGLLLLFGGISLVQAGWGQEAGAVKNDLALISRADAGSSGVYIEKAQKALTEAGALFDTLTQEQATASALAPYQAAVLPLNTFSPELEEALSSFVSSGGKLIVLYTASPAVARLVGIESLTYTSPEYEGQFAEIVQSAEPAPGAPAAVRFNSWNVFVPTLLPSARVVGEWRDAAGKLTGIPALVESPAGYYIGHILTGADGEAQARLIGALIAQVAPKAWKGALERRAARALKLGEFETVSELRAFLDSQPASQRITEALSWATLAEEKFAKAERHLMRGLFVEADLALTEASKALQEAYARAHPPAPSEFRGVWLVPDSSTNWDKVCANLAQHGFNMVLPRMARGGNCIYKSAILPMDTWAQSKGDQLAQAVAAAHKHGLELHAWRVNFHLGTAPKWYYDQLAAEDRLVRDASGEQGYTWACPSNERNRQVEVAAMLEMAENYDVDGVHFDYIRYPNTSFCYCATCRRNFEQALGVKVENWPQDVLTGDLQSAYIQWEQGNINSLVREVYRKVKAIKPWVQVSAAVFPRSATSRYTIKQDWPTWAREGYIDFVCPMDYTADSATLSRYAQDDVKRAEGRAPVAIGIGSYLHDSPEETLHQLALAKSAGADGFVLFSYSGWLPTEGMAQLAKGPLSQPAEVPVPAPEVTWLLPQGLASEAPTSYRAGTELVVGAKLTENEGVSLDELHFSLLNLDSQKAQELVPVARYDGIQDLAFEAPEGPSQLVISGEMILPEGAKRIFARRSAVFQGLSEEAADKLLAELAPPVIETDLPKVGILEPGVGSSGIKATLEEVAGFYPVYLARIDPEFLAAVDVVIIPQVSAPDLLSPRALNRLREWVRTGGRVLLTHDAVGFRVHLAPFPELGYGLGREEKRSCSAPVNPAPLVKTNLAPGEKFVPAYSDHIALSATDRASVVLQDSKGQPVVVAGAFGQGKVVLCGLVPGYVAGEEVPVKGWEKQLLLDLLQWLAQD